MRKRVVAAIVVGSVLAVAVGGTYWAGRNLFHEPTAEGVDSVIGASQENYMQESYILPTWLIYALWDNEFHLVRDLEKDPV
ncbi:hypothetical protein C2138_12400 [Salinibacterium hongtaonis]|nr:hypothetical protein C2138_12400 [Salinibacterium hongtaonis]